MTVHGHLKRILHKGMVSNECITNDVSLAFTTNDFYTEARDLSIYATVPDLHVELTEDLSLVYSYLYVQSHCNTSSAVRTRMSKAFLTYFSSAMGLALTTRMTYLPFTTELVIKI